MKSIFFVIFAGLFMSLQSLACMPAMSEEIIKHVYMPTNQVIVLEMGGNKFLSSSVVYHLSSLVHNDESLLLNEMKVDEKVLKMTFSVETSSLKFQAMGPGETTVTLEALSDQKDETGKRQKRVIFDQKIKVDLHPTPRGC